MKLPRLYQDLAPWWPILVRPEDLATEAAFIGRLLARHLGPPPTAAGFACLELGAGSGGTLGLLAETCRCTAVDLSEPMLAHCRHRYPQVATHRGDMRSIRLGCTFDAVLALDSIDHLTSSRDLKAACLTAAVHLRPGGLFLVAPSCTREHFTDHETAWDTATDDQTELAYVTHVYRTAADVAGYETVVSLLIRERGTLRIEQDRYRCGLFDTATWLKLFKETGFDCHRHVLTSGEDEHEDEAAMVWFACIWLGTTRTSNRPQQAAGC